LTQLAVEMETNPVTLAQMSFEEFRRSIEDPASASPPTELAPALLALWHDARGDWDQAHRCAQDDRSTAGSWVHAYLHRKEGDRGNAGYWYSRAHRKMPAADVSLESEWKEITRALLKTN
jgi:hypothetical protein